MSAGNAPQQDFEAIAVIGMSCRFPGADTPEQFWENLRDGVESIRTFGDDEIDPRVPRDLLADPNYIRRRGVIEGIDRFDARFFGLSGLEARIMDPQHRVFLELAWEALERAGYPPGRTRDLTGVFAGAGNPTYFYQNILTRPDVVETLGEYQTMVSNEKDFLATRTSYSLGLKGPSISMYTACSTSLVCIGHACDSLLNYQCDLALAGGISLLLPQNSGYLYRDVMILSRDGHCRAFDDRASGTVSSNGGGLVVLKRLSEALEDGDEVLAVIRGAGICNDGGDKMSFTAPSVDGQAEAIRMALANSELAPEEITYVEAHGTGTRIGDPIEVEALSQVYGQDTDRRQFCGLGSVKTNIGHLDTAAGVAGFIKIVLAMAHRQLPPSLHYETPNPAIDFGASPFYVVDSLRDWDADGRPLRAGISSFGIGGTNSHVILEEPPSRPAPPAAPAAGPWLLAFSAKSRASLDGNTAACADYLAATESAPLGDVAGTLLYARNEFRHRRVAVCGDLQEARERLAAPAKSKFVKSGTAATAARDVAFVFPGQGAQQVDMGREFYRNDASFRACVDECAGILEPLLGLDLRAILYPDGGDPAAAAEQLKQTAISQPALFVIEYALARSWIERGVEPAAMMGHSLGEYVAACLAGVFSLADGLHLVAHRGRLMQEMEPGSMLAVRRTEAQLLESLPGSLVVAAVNAPDLCTVSGPTPAIEAYAETLDSERVFCRVLDTSHAFHSEMMDGCLEPFARIVAAVELSPPSIPVVSTATGTWLTREEAVDPQYWARHLRHPVRFSQGIETLWEDPDRVLLEVGPGTTALRLAQAHITDPKRQAAHGTLAHAARVEDERQSFLLTLGELWTCGVEVDWKRSFDPDAYRLQPLPTYVFDRERHWVEPGRAVAGAAADAPEESSPQPAGTPAGSQETSPATGPVDTTGMLREIWLETLPDVEEVEEDDDFFELGGHSMLAVSLFAAIKSRTGVDLPLSTLYDAPTIRSLSRILESHESMRGSEDVVVQGAAVRTDDATAAPRSTGERVLRTLRFLALHPREFVTHWVSPLWRGLRLKARHAMNPRVSIGWFARPECPVIIRGPGRVEIGKHVQFAWNALEEVAILTTHPDAVVRIGARTGLGGVKILCARSVRIGANCMFAKSYISDVDFPDDPPERAKPVVVEDYCWVSGDGGLLPGSRLGEGSTLGIASVLSEKEIKPGYLAIGRPARAVARVTGND